MDHYTPRQNDGFPPYLDPERFYRPTPYIATSSFDISQTDVLNGEYRALEWAYPPGVYSSNALFLPVANHVSLFAKVIRTPEAIAYDGSLEILLIPGIGSPGSQEDPVCASWIWGPDMAMADPFASNVEGWVCSVSGFRQIYSVWVKTGMAPGTPPAAVVLLSITALLSDGPVSYRDAINPRCSVPPFDPSGGYLFLAQGKEPSQQKAQNQRQWQSKEVERTEEDDVVLIHNIFGGPWNGQISGAGGAGNITLDTYGHDFTPFAPVTTGVLLESSTLQITQARIQHPAHFNRHQMNLTNVAGEAQTVRYAIGLGSPTR
ncbi:MAG: hypothetical protein ACYTEQ_05190 [Planctomycetota bacterium]|jgi:hypothetical protein